jgi:phosphoribosylglycinamide formyltransferase 1
MSARKRVGVLISGRGSNMMALAAAARDADYPADIVCVVSNRPEAEGLKHAAAMGIATKVIDHQAYGSREAFEAALNQYLQSQRLDFIALAGFMRMLTPGFVESWRDRHLNIHPSLLPAFRGLHTHERVIAAGCKISGCTVHFVRVEMDEGPIVAQAAVPVLAADTAETLALRVLETEHRLYPHALALVASGAVSVQGERVVCTDQGERVIDTNDQNDQAQVPLFSPPVP